MPLFACDKCGCVENTALCLFWMSWDSAERLCSECDPKIGKWHGAFPKKKSEAGDDLITK